MTQEVVSILVLVAIFVIGTLRPINMGLLGITAAFVVGSAVGVSEDDIFAGFPGDLFIILVGVTCLFAIANNNGTVDWLVHAAVRAVGGRVALIGVGDVRDHSAADRGRARSSRLRWRSSRRSRSASPSATGSAR
jgi:di/tricarboxylate transporter